MKRNRQPDRTYSFPHKEYEECASNLIVQFGEGNFLRAFVDWIVQRMNERTDFNGKVVIVKPRPGDGLKRLQAQGCRYHVSLRGLQDGKVVDSLEEINCISRAINPYEEYDAFLALATHPELRFVVSNTTEAGIVYDPECHFKDAPPSSFPAKLTQLLYHRYHAFGGDKSKGLIILPCELIYGNGVELERCVNNYIVQWANEIDDDIRPFIQWVGEACHFCTTLVDRIVPGYPRNDADALQARLPQPDPLLVQAEPYHLWVIQAARHLPVEELQRLFPAAEAGLSVITTTDETPYHQRKVTLLNGTHSVMAPIGLLAGVATVREACEHPVLGPFLRHVMLEELLPTVTLPEAELRTFADSVWERFLNPFIDHPLTSIMLNAVSKYRTRDLPALKIHLQRTGRLPHGLVLGLAAIMAQVSDADRTEADVLMKEVPGLAKAVTADLLGIRESGILIQVRPLLRIHPSDSVAVALTELSSGQIFDAASSPDGQPLHLLSAIPTGHKVALCDLPQGADVIKYGYPIGHTVREVRRGELVNHECIATNLERSASLNNVSTTASPFKEREAETSEDKRLTGDKGNHSPILGKSLTFPAYLRPDGQAGIRNDIWVIPTVGCINKVCQRIVDCAKEELSIDNRQLSIVGFSHPYGCSQLGDDHENTRRILRAMVRHPNAGGILVVGLGCENNQPAAFREFCGDYDRQRVRFLTCQQVEGDEVEEGVRMVRELYAQAQTFTRTDVPLSSLRVGLKCGGSDGLSGITANPLLGRFSDWLCSQGGTTVLTEVPEMFGAEPLLTGQAASPAVARQIDNLIGSFKQYYRDHGQPVGENPSPGNKAGGISTLEEKALGCTQKAGTSIVQGVLAYGQRLDEVKKEGLHLLCAPGNDLVASTALAAAGCQLVLFTTGRGTPFATFVPTLKISTNSDLACRKPHWIDFDAGTLVSAGECMDVLLARFIDLILTIVGGQPTRAELAGIHDIAIWKNGVTL